MTSIVHRRVMQDGAVSSSTWPWTGTFAVPSGTHTLKWKYVKYSGSAWVDAIQWTGGGRKGRSPHQARLSRSCRPAMPCRHASETWGKMS